MCIFVGIAYVLAEQIASEDALTTWQAYKQIHQHQPPDCRLSVARMEKRGVTMSQGLEGAAIGFANDPYEDAIEQEPVDEQVLGLSPAFRGLISRRQVRSDFVCAVTLAVIAVGIAATIVFRVPDRSPPPSTITSAAWVVSAPAAPTESQDAAPVRVRNPFDATEVFEFPAETSRTEAREAMAELLMKRARDRLGQGLGINAGNHHPARGAAERSKQTAEDRRSPDVFVTKLSAYAGPTRRL